MDVALRVVESVTMMHNGRIFKEGRPEEIESDPEVQELYLGGGHGGGHALTRAARPRHRRADARSVGPQRLLRPFARAAGRRSHARSSGVLVGRRPQRHGQDHAVQDHHGPGARVERLDPLRRRGVDRPLAGARSRGSASATCRRDAGCGARSPSTSICALSRRSARSGWTIERIYDTFPRLAERKSNRACATVGRRAADARDLARAARSIRACW